ncbi:MAG: pitrilysin family protein, partial [Nitrospinota bacterium]|nr:pitrilysin family protein [Nitrospinota bacterium]
RDNPFIPYDDYYTSREFSFIRFETIDKFYKEALYNFSDIVLNPSFLEEDIEDVKAEAINLIKEESENPSKIASNLLYESLFTGNLFSRRINGTEKSIESITRQDLEKFYKYYFAPNNLIISIATSVGREQVLKEFEIYFKTRSPSKVPPLSSDEYPDVSKEKTMRKSLNKTQSYIRLGVLFKMNEDDEAGFRVLASILSQNLSQNLREKKGLAYSLGAGFSMHNKYGLFQIAVGTRAKTLDEAGKGIYNEIEQIKNKMVSSNRLNKLINSYNSRRLMRSLTRISQCFQAGLNEFYGRSFNHNEKLLREIKKLSSEEVQQKARNYLKRENMVKIIVK